MTKSHATAWPSAGPTADQLKEFFAQIASGRVTKDRLQAFLLGEEIFTTESQKRACEIMGQNFLGVDDIARYWPVVPVPSDRKAFAEIPFSEATLEACKDTHILVADFGLSILDLRSKIDSKLFYEQSWYDREVFASDVNNHAWRLVRKTPVENSTRKTWDEQQAFLSESEETPTARTVIYTMVGYYLASGERLFEDVYVRCSDVDSDGYRVVVGHFDRRGLVVDDGRDADRSSGLGVASSRKFD